MTAPASSVTVHADQIYGAVLDTDSLPRRFRSDPRRLGYLFEEWLPVPIEEVHAVYRKIDANTTLAVGVDRQLMNQCDDRESDPMCPAELPEHLRFEGIHLEQLDLRTGPFTPRQVRTLRRWTLFAATIGLTALIGVLSAGMLKRAETASHQAARANEHRLKLLADALPASAQDSRPGWVRLITEIRRLEAAAHTNSPRRLAADAILARSLSSWPGDLAMRTQRMSVSQDTLRIIADVESPAIAQQLAESLSPPDGWEADPPRVGNQGRLTRVTIVHRSMEVE